MRTWILERFRAYGQRLVLTSLVCAPIIFHRSTLDVFNLVKLWVLWVLGLLALWVWFAWSAERGIWLPRFRIGYAAAAFLGAFGLATVFSQNRFISILGVYHRYGGFVPIALYAAIMFVIVGLYWEKPERLKSIATAVALATVPVSFYALIQAAGQDWVAWRLLDGARPEFSVSTMGNSNFAGGYLGICLPFILYSVLSARPSRLFFFGLAAILDVIALWFTGSRGGMISAAAALGSFAFLLRDLLKPWVRRSMAAVTAAGVILVIFVAWRPSLGSFDGVAEAGVLRTNTLELRREYWTAAWRIFLDHPLIGTGPDTYYSNYGRYRSARDGLMQGFSSTDKPHNIYLEYAANSGVAGLGTYLALTGLALWSAARLARRPEYAHRRLLVCFTSALVAYLAQGFFSIDVPPLAVMGWVCLAGIAVLADPGVLAAQAARAAVFEAKLGRIKGASASPNEELELVSAGAGRARPAPRRAAQAIAAVATAGLVALGSRLLIADARAKSAGRLIRTAQVKPATAGQSLALLGQAARLNPLESMYLRMAGDTLETRAQQASGGVEKDRLFKQASGRLLQSQKLEPNNVFIAVDIARLYSGWAQATNDPERFEEADHWWRRATALDPTNWELRFHYGTFLHLWGVTTNQEGMMSRAVEHLERSAKIRPDRPTVWKELGRAQLSIGEKELARQALERAHAMAPADPALNELLDRARKSG